MSNNKSNKSKVKSQKLKVGILGATGMVGQRFVSLLENHQQNDGTIKVPEVLQKYIGKSVIS